jgi:glycosyltransferase involved in cell wall biosynthesis
MSLKKENNATNEMNKDIANPLVSIIVITYNSSKHVIETLESAKAQTYKNIELIISDDCSTDDTAEICQNWIKKNNSRFVRTEIIKAKKNRGIAPNCNQGLFNAKGEWVKFIAGDDMLIYNCIETNLNLVKDSEHSFFFSKMKFSQKNERLREICDSGFKLFNSDDVQLKIILRGNVLTAPSSFIRVKTLLKLEGFDERFPMVEDYPMWLKAVKNNYKIIFNDVETVTYRISNNGISQSETATNKKLFCENLNFKKSWYNFLVKEIFKEQLLYNMPIRALNTLIEVAQFKVIILFNNKKNNFSVLLRNSLAIFKPNFYNNLLEKLKD